jgi:hypothetical protein
VAEAEPTGAALARQEWQKAKAERARRTGGVPSLHLLIWATPDCMRSSLVIYYTTPGQRRTCRVLRQAAWTPRTVDERRLVEWGQRSLTSWLESGEEVTEITELPWSR